MKKLRFETENANHGLTTARGFAWYTDKGVMFEYRVSDSIFEIMKSDIKDLFISYDQIDRIEHKNSWFSGGTVSIEVNSMKSLENVAFLDENILSLSLERKNKNHGKDFAVNAQLELMNYNMNKLDS